MRSILPDLLRCSRVSLSAVRPDAAVVAAAATIVPAFTVRQQDSCNAKEQRRRLHLAPQQQQPQWSPRLGAHDGRRGRGKEGRGASVESSTQRTRRPLAIAMRRARCAALFLHSQQDCSHLEHSIGMVQAPSNRGQTGMLITPRCDLRRASETRACAQRSPVGRERIEGALLHDRTTVQTIIQLTPRLPVSSAARQESTPCTADHCYRGSRFRRHRADSSASRSTVTALRL